MSLRTFSILILGFSLVSISCFASQWPAPEPISPEANQVIYSDQEEVEKVTFRWNPVPGALKYLITIYYDTHNTIRRDWEEGTSGQVSLALGHTYTWDVRAVGDQGEGGPSKKISFKITTEPDDDHLFTRNSWMNFEIGPSYLAENVQAYSGGIGIAYTPIFSIGKSPKLVAAPLFGVQLAKESGANIFPIFEIDGQIRFYFMKKFFAEPGLGLGQALQSQESAGVFFLSSLDVGMMVNDLFGIRFGPVKMDRLVFRYASLFTPVATQQFELGIGLNFGGEP